MTATQEVLLLCDRKYEDDFWHVHPEVHDVIGWWPDGSPAWLDHIGLPEASPIVVDVIPKRQPIDDDWVEDDPRVLRLIDLALAMNDIHRLAQGRVPLAATRVPTSAAEVAEAILERIRASFGEDEVSHVLSLAMQIESDRRAAAT